MGRSFVCFFKITNMTLPLQIKIHHGKKNSAECKEDARTTTDCSGLAKTCNNRSPDPVPRSTTLERAGPICPVTKTAERSFIAHASLQKAQADASPIHSGDTVPARVSYFSLHKSHISLLSGNLAIYSREDSLKPVSANSTSTSS